MSMLDSASDLHMLIMQNYKKLLDSTSDLHMLIMQNYKKRLEESKIPEEREALRNLIEMEKARWEAFRDSQ